MNTSSSETASAKWRGISLILVGIIFLNTGIFAYVYLNRQTDFDEFQSQFAGLLDQLFENQQEIQRLQQKIEIIQY
ncbi:MAG: hypothetical protein ACXADB_15040, partial [Candidatus Hermodarchaeia archaeon]